MFRVLCLDAVRLAPLPPALNSDLRRGICGTGTYVLLRYSLGIFDDRSGNM